MLRKEKCTGDPARRLGNDLAFGQLAESNLETLQQSKVKKIVSICPHCVRTIGTDWANMRRVRRSPAHRASQRVSGAAFGSACRSGRARARRSFITIPAIWAAIATCTMSRATWSASSERWSIRRASRERSFCCGAGGGLAFLGEEKGKRVSVERAEELVATGASVVAAACPFCNTMFRDALSGVSATPPKLLDIAQIAAAAFAPAGPGGSA